MADETTTFEDIIDLAVISIRDYKLDELFVTDEADFTTYLSGFVVKSIPKFYECTQAIEDADLTDGDFGILLTLREKIILSDLTVIEWMTSKILDVTQFQLHLNDTDFKRYSEAQNLTSKINAQNMIREKVNQDMTVYGLKTTDWSTYLGEGTDYYTTYGNSYKSGRCF